MTRSMRSRFREEMPPPPPETPGPAGGIVAFLGNVALLGLVIFLGWLAIGWTLNDISGDYYAGHPQLGPIRLTLIRRATGLKGEIYYGGGAAMAITEGDIRDGNRIEFKYQRPQQWVDAGQAPRSGVFRGEMGKSVEAGGYGTQKEFATLSGVLEEAGYRFEVVFSRNALSSLFRQFQSHLPWTG